MNKLSLQLLKIDSYFYKSWYMFSELCLAWLYPHPKMRILFSTKGGKEKKIEFFFRFLHHTITFAEITPETLAAHDLVIALHIEDVFYLNTVRHLIKNNPIPTPSIEAVRVCDDKYLFAQKMLENNFGAYIPQIDGDLPYPFFFKKKIDLAGKHSYFVETPQQYLALLNSVNSEEFFRQKFIPNTSDYTAHILFENQQIVRCITLEYFYDKNCAIAGKDDMLGTKMHRSNPYLDLFAAILNSIGYEGICAFNYRIIDNIPYIFEINPRFGGHLSLFFFSFLRSLK